MTVNVSKPAKSIRDLEAELLGRTKQSPEIVFEHEFDGAVGFVKLGPGQKPLRVYLNGLRQREGSANDYTVSFDGFLYTVTWVVTPNNTSVALIDVEIVQ